LGTLEDVLIKIGDLWVLEDFFITDMTKTDDTQIILDDPFWLLQVARLM